MVSFSQKWLNLARLQLQVPPPSMVEDESMDVLAAYEEQKNAPMYTYYNMPPLLQEEILLRNVSVKGTKFLCVIQSVTLYYIQLRYVVCI